MAALFLPLFAFLTLLVPVHDSFLQMHEQVRALAELDRKLGDGAESASDAINSALALNNALRALYVACPAAIVSGSESVLEMEGNIIRLQQELLLYEAQMTTWSFNPTSFSTEFNRPSRNNASVCQIPGTLYCTHLTLFEIKHRDGAKPAGVKAESETCSTVNWHYADPRVKAL